MLVRLFKTLPSYNCLQNKNCLHTSKHSTRKCPCIDFCKTACFHYTCFPRGDQFFPYMDLTFTIKISYLWDDCPRLFNIKVLPRLQIEFKATTHAHRQRPLLIPVGVNQIPRHLAKEFSQLRRNTIRLSGSYCLAHLPCLQGTTENSIVCKWFSCVSGDKEASPQELYLY